MLNAANFSVGCHINAASIPLACYLPVAQAYCENYLVPAFIKINGPLANFVHKDMQGEVDAIVNSLRSVRLFAVRDAFLNEWEHSLKKELFSYLEHKCSLKVVPLFKKILPNILEAEFNLLPGIHWDEIKVKISPSVLEKGLVKSLSSVVQKRLGDSNTDSVVSNAYNDALQSAFEHEEYKLFEAASDVSENPKGWQRYYDQTSIFDDPNDDLERAFESFKNEGKSQGLALDLGCGAGIDSAFLAKNNWQVIAMDADPVAEIYLGKKVPKEFQSLVTYRHSTFEAYPFSEKVDLVNAHSSLMYCSTKDFDSVMKRLLNSIAPGGRFAGQFQGLKPGAKSDADSKRITLKSKEELLELFRGFDIESFEEIVPKSDDSIFFHIIAKKRKS